MNASALLLGATLIAGTAFAKLPDPTPEAKEAAAAKKEKADMAAKVDAYNLCLSQDKAVKGYFASAAGKGKQGAAMAPCADPGKVAAAAPAKKK